MRTTIVTDAACDLPADFCSEQGVEILPIHLHFGERVFLDVRKVPMTLGFYRSYLADKNLPVETSPLSVNEMREYFRGLAPKYDNAILITISSKRSPIYRHAVEATTAAAIAPRRNGNAVAVPAVHPLNGFSVHVIDSQTLFTGQGVLVYAALRALKDGMACENVVQHVQHLVHNVHSFLVPSDLYYIRMRARKKGEQSISLMRYLLGMALDVKPIIGGYLGETQVVAKTRGFEAALQQLFAMAVARLEKGLSVPLIAVSYAGDPRVITGKECFRKFAAKANHHGVQVLTSVMGPTGGINVGPGALSLSYAS